MAVVIADAGPLIALAKISQLHLLPALFTKVLIKQALESGWLECVDNPVFTHPLSRSLGLGEQTSIEYALQTDNKTLLVMDDALARKQALCKQLNIVGTAALLFAAQRKGLLADAETLIAELNQVGYRISAAVIAQLKNGIA